MKNQEQYVVNESARVYKELRDRGASHKQALEQTLIEAIEYLNRCRAVQALQAKKASK